MSTNPEIIAFMQGLTETERRIVDALSRQASLPAPDIWEAIKWQALCFFKGDRAFAGIMPYKKYVSLIFDRGALLDDPHHVLEGGGHTMRHIKLHAFDDLDRKHTAAYIMQSYHIKEEPDK